jgi:hypothetical protein
MATSEPRSEAESRRDLATEEGRGGVTRQSPIGRLCADVEPLLDALSAALAAKAELEQEYAALHRQYLDQTSEANGLLAHERMLRGTAEDRLRAVHAVLSERDPMDDAETLAAKIRQATVIPPEQENPHG